MTGPHQNIKGNPTHYMNTKSVVVALAALAQDTRLAIYRLLVKSGTDGLAAGQIGEQLGITPSSLSFHIKELNHAGLVTSRQESRYVIYSVNYGVVENLMAYLHENCCALSSDPVSTTKADADTGLCI
jgi:ArsR family transcriptional regulator